MVRTSSRRRFSCIALFAIALAGASSSVVDGAATAQEARPSDLSVLKNRLQQRFQLLPLHSGVALSPRFKTTIRSIEVSAGVIAVDGVETTGNELRAKLGADADLVLQLSYLGPSSFAAVIGTAAPPSSEPPAAPAAAAPAPDAAARPARTGRRGALVRFGGSVTVPSNEAVTDDVVVIGGSADIDGEVQGEVVVIGGTATLGPHADIRRDVTVVGGTLQRDPAAIVGGRVNEVGVGGSATGSRAFGRHGGFDTGWPFARLTPFIRLMGTFVRIGLLILLASVIVLVAQTPVEQIAERAAAEPLKAGLVGFLLELVFLPGLLVIVVFLAVSIIGIPLLPLVPLAILAFVIVLLLGFTGVSYWVGRQAEVRFGWPTGRRYVATMLGIAVILSPLILGRFVGLVGGFGFIGGALIGLGVLLEYVGWTVGLGAAALVQFRLRAARARPVGPVGASLPAPSPSPEG